MPSQLGGGETSRLSQPAQQASPEWQRRSVAQRSIIWNSVTESSAPMGAEMACCPTQ